MPRRGYTMQKRAVALEETRRRIIEATMQIRDEQGMADASWQDIANLAGVSLSTMYRHFAGNDELIQACGAAVFEDLPPPNPQDAGPTFAGLEGVERLERLIDEVYGYYERTDPMMAQVRRDLHRSTAVADGFEAIRTGIEAFILEALRPLRVSAAQTKLVRAFLDDRVWSSLIDAGMTPPVAKEHCLASLKVAARL